MGGGGPSAPRGRVGDMSGFPLGDARRYWREDRSSQHKETRTAPKLDASRNPPLPARPPLFPISDNATRRARLKPYASPPAQIGKASLRIHGARDVSNSRIIEPGARAGSRYARKIRGPLVPSAAPYLGYIEARDAFPLLPISGRGYVRNPHRANICTYDRR